VKLSALAPISLDAPVNMTGVSLFPCTCTRNMIDYHHKNSGGVSWEQVDLAMQLTSGMPDAETETLTLCIPPEKADWNPKN
jgi:hypothetical protein